jgi:hypothetical protein
MAEIGGALFALDYLLTLLRTPRSSRKSVSTYHPRRLR